MKPLFSKPTSASPLLLLGALSIGALSLGACGKNGGPAADASGPDTKEVSGTADEEPASTSDPASVEDSGAESDAEVEESSGPTDNTCSDGERKQAEDGCNQCSCRKGIWACTKKACLPR